MNRARIDNVAENLPINCDRINFGSSAGAAATGSASDAPMADAPVASAPSAKEGTGRAFFGVQLQRWDYPYP